MDPAAKADKTSITTSGPLRIASHGDNPVAFAVRAALWVACSTAATTVSCAFLLTSALVRPFSRTLAYDFNSMTAYALWQYYQWLFQSVHHADVTISGDEVPEGESALIIANHTSYSDFWLVHALARRKGMLGRCRYFAKNELRYVPILGWALLLCDMIMVKRDWQRDYSQLGAMFSGVRKYKLKVWLVTYVEATRFSKKKAIASREYAEKHGKPILEHVLLPRYRGFAATLAGLKGSHVDHVYDLTMAYRDVETGQIQRAPTPIQTLGHADLRGRYQFHLHVRRFAVADLPDTEAGIKRWLEERWAAKDDLLKAMAIDWTNAKILGNVHSC